jgi:hypothetical protein
MLSIEFELVSRYKLSLLGLQDPRLAIALLAFTNTSSAETCGKHHALQTDFMVG